MRCALHLRGGVPRPYFPYPPATATLLERVLEMLYWLRCQRVGMLLCGRAGEHRFFLSPPHPLRRFSSGDLSSNGEDQEDVKEKIPPQKQQQQQAKAQQQQQQQQQQQSHASSHGIFHQNDLSLSFRTGSKTISAPSSPLKSRETFLQKVSSLTSAAVGKADHHLVRFPQHREKFKCLLVVDDQRTDWSKYFRGRKLSGDYEIHVEQAEFKELSLHCTNERGAEVSLTSYRGGSRVHRVFRPDFVLFRQNLRDAGEDYKNLLLGLKYCDIPSVNTLTAIYNFQDKPWIFGHLMDIQRRLGKETFPLIEQNYYPNHREMAIDPRFPVVCKIGHAHNGLGKLRIENQEDYIDASSVVAVAQAYCTTEPYIDAKYDIHVQKIGSKYKAFIWKTSTTHSLLEQINVMEQYRVWVDEVSQLFGGLDICSVEAVVDKDGREHIIEVNDSALSLLGDTQEEDRRQISDLVFSKMQALLIRQTTYGSLQLESSPTDERSAPLPSQIDNHVPAAAAPAGTQRHDSLSSQSSLVESTSGHSRTASKHENVVQDAQSQSPPPPPPPPLRSYFTRQGSQQQSTEDGDDTMKNLRKTFAGIFGEMS